MVLKKLKEKLSKARELDRKLSDEAKKNIRERAKEYFADPRLFALIVAEVLLVIMILFSILYLFDSDVEFTLLAPVPQEIKLIVFAAGILLAARIYSKTEEYRKSMKSKKAANN